MFRTAFAPSITLVVLSLVACDAFISESQRLERARTALATGDLGRAEIELAKVLRKAPQNSDARLLLAKLSLAEGDIQEAQSSLEHAIAAGARGPDVDSLRIDAWIAANQPKELIDALEKGDLQLPDPARHVALARAYIELGKPDRAMQTLTTDSASTQERLLRAEALVLQGQSDQALREIASALAKEPGSYSVLLLKARILMLQGEYAAAESSLSIARQHMSHAAPPAQQALLLAVTTEARLAQGKRQSASESQQELASLLPDASITHLLDARLKLAAGDYLAAVAELQRLLVAAPDYLPARIELGAAQLTQGNLMQAEAELAEVVQSAADNLEARKLLARVRLQLQQPQAAIRALLPALDSTTADAEAYALVGVLRARSGDSTAAIDTLKRGVTAYPDDVDLKLDLGRTYLAAGRAADALNLLEQLDGNADLPRRDALLIAAVREEEGARAARIEVEKLIAARPRSVPTLNVAATYFAFQWEFDRARALLRSALALDPHSLVTLVNLARIDVATGENGRAETWLRTALALNEANDQVRIALSDLMAHRGATQEAAKLLEARLASSPGFELQLALARVQFSAGDAASAISVLDRAVSAYPARADLANRAGELLLEEGQYGAAVVRFQKAAEMTPSDATYWLNEGRAQLGLNDPNAARESLKKALLARPDWIPAIAALTVIELRAKNYQAALERSGDLLERQPADPDALVLRGDVQAAAGKLREAADTYAQAQRVRPDATTAVKLYKTQRDGGLPKPQSALLQWLAIQPTDYRVRSMLAEYYLTTRNLSDAAAEFEQVIQQTPGNAVALNNLACVYLQADDPRAESAAERAYGIAPASAAVADTLGWILARKHANERALGLLEKAARSDPDDPDIQYHYAFALVQAGRPGEARGILARALSGSRPFRARYDAERLLTELGHEPPLVKESSSVAQCREISPSGHEDARNSTAHRFSAHGYRPGAAAHRPPGGDIGRHLAIRDRAG